MSAPEDDRLISLLGRALAHADPVPASVQRVALGALAWRTIDADLAALAYDSGMEEAVGARSDEVARQLTFGSPGLEIEIMVVPEHGRRLVGQLVPPRAATVGLTCGDQVLETTSDDLGRFRFEGVGSGPTRLSVSAGPDGPHVETEWVVL